MILKRPYAFFIKMFKPIHLILGGLILLLIYLSNNILDIVNNYMYSSESFIEKSVLEKMTNNFIYIIPIILIIFCIFLLSIMYKKNKPILFYFINIFVFLVILVTNIYSVNFLNVLVENIASFKAIKLIHDLVVISIILESVSFFAFFVRGMGIDLKKFDFNSDVHKLEISEKDSEEFEFNINIDFNERKRNRKYKIRNLKYKYIENKFIINILLFIVIVVIILTTFIIIIKNNKVNEEGKFFSLDSFEFKVNNSILLNTDYQGKKITDNYLIVVNMNIKSNYNKSFLYLNDFSLKIGNLRFKPIKKYFDDLIDLGIFYEEQVLPTKYTDYLIVYEIPEKYINEEMYFSYNSEGNVIDVLLNPNKLVNTKLTKTNKKMEEVKLEGTLQGISFVISDFSIKEQILINYNYCIKENDCIPSKEYLKPTLNENYDKVILALDVVYESSSDLNVKTFYKLLSKFGAIQYKLDGKWYSTSKFEEILSKKSYIRNKVYIGVNSDISKAEEIKIVFKVRETKQEYILK